MTTHYRIRPARHGQMIAALILSATLAATGCTAAMYSPAHEQPASTAGFTSLDRAAASKAGEGRVNATPAPQQPADKAEPAYKLANFKTPGSEPQAPPAGGEKRIIIYTASYKLVVSEIEESLHQTEKMAAELGGWVQEIRGDSITIRVPAAKYEDATRRVEALGRVAQRDQQAADVTEEYVDLEARLKNAMAVRQRLQALLDKAEDVKAALEVEKEMTRVGEEIERLQAKINLLQNRVAYSTISVAFERVSRTPQTPQLLKLPFDWLRELDPNRLTSSY